MLFVSVCSELMPPLPKGGVFEIEEIISSKRHIATTVSYMYDYHACSMICVLSCDLILSCDFLSFSGSGRIMNMSGDPMEKSRTESLR